MIDWRIREDGFDPEKITHNGNKFLIGNGYMGVRGTLQEYEKEQFAAVNLAGIYDRVGDGWREPLNAPNGLFTYAAFRGKEYRLPDAAPGSHSARLDYRHGIFERSTVWETPSGKLSIRAERFASMEQKHLLVMKYTLESEGPGEAVITTGIDAGVWDINGPHYDEVSMPIPDGTGQLLVTATTHESRAQVVVCEECVIDFSAAVDASAVNSIEAGSFALDSFAADNLTLDDSDTDHPVRQEVIRDGLKLLRKLSFRMKAGVPYVIYKYVSVYTSKDTPSYELEARELVDRARKAGYAALLKEHSGVWEKLWRTSGVVIEGDDKAMEALNYSLYHLHCIAPRHTDHLSIAARGLSGQTYKGAVFWDTEMFMLDFFLFTEPKVAKTLLKYRVDTLEGAKRKAKDYGYEGAFYAWESQEGGYDACSDYNVTDVFTGRQMRTYFKDKQIHISAAVVHGIMRYVRYTGSMDLLAEGGAEVILECARFYYDLLLRRVDRDYYELHDVIGPDEYHERVNNNAYTNRMARFTFDSAVWVLKRLEEIEREVGEQKAVEGISEERILEEGMAGKWETAERIRKNYDTGKLLTQFMDAAEKLYIPEPDGDGIIEQFDGYGKLEDAGIEEVRGRLLHEKEYWGGAYGVATHTKVIKQADVVTMLNLFSEDYSEDILSRNWEYYEPRTEHGSSLSACMYAILACKCHKPDRAYPFFMKSALSDLGGEGKEWAGLIYIGGTHPASSGGAYMTVVEGFAGLHLRDGIQEKLTGQASCHRLTASPCLPSHWIRLSFHVIYLGKLYQVEVTQKESRVICLGEAGQIF